MSDLFRQVIVLAWPGLGLGAFGSDPAHASAHTLSNLASYVGGLELPNLAWLGLGRLAAIRGLPAVDVPAASCARLAPGRADRPLEEALGPALALLRAQEREVHLVGTAHDLVGKPKGAVVHDSGARGTFGVLEDLLTRGGRGVIVASPTAAEAPSTGSPVSAARSLARLDDGLGRVLERTGERSDVLLMVTSNGGQDTVLRSGPTREWVPLLAQSAAFPSGAALGERDLRDLGPTAAEALGVAAEGRSLLAEILA